MEQEVNAEFRLDRTVFRAMNVEQADKEMTNYASLSWQERLAVAYYLNSVAYNFPLNNPPNIDRTICTPRKLING